MCKIGFCIDLRLNGGRIEYLVKIKKKFADGDDDDFEVINSEKLKRLVPKMMATFLETLVSFVMGDQSAADEPQNPQNPSGNPIEIACEFCSVEF